MNIFASPLLWIGVILYFLFSKKSLDGGFNSTGGGFVTPVIKPNIQNPDGSWVIQPTITTAKARSLAYQLHEEFSEFIPDNSDILTLLKGLNEADYVMVYNAYGEKSIRFTSSHDLTYWLVEILDNTADLNKLKKQFPNIF